MDPILNPFCYENVSCESVDDGAACQEEDDRAFAACPTLGAGACNFDCSLCAGETRSMCESFQGVCDTLAGAERTTCCNDVTAIYSIMCRS
jgi:hypothetical protein